MYLITQLIGVSLGRIRGQLNRTFYKRISTMTNIITDSFSIIIPVLRNVGVLYSPNRSKLSKIFTYLSYFSTMSVGIMVFVNRLVAKHVNNMESIQMDIFLVICLAACSKLLPFFLYGQKVKEYIEFFGSEAFIPKSAEEKRITNNCVQVCQQMVKVYVTIIACTEVCWNIFPLFEERFPVNIWVPFEVAPGSLLFYATYLYVVSAFMYMGFVCEMMEPLVAGLAFHTTGQLKILKYHPSNLIPEENLDRNDNDRIHFESVSKTLNHCVVLHNDILNFTGDFEKYLSWTVFCQISAVLVALCYCCIGLTLESSSMDLVTYIISYSIMALQLFFYCHFGTILYEENNDLRDAIYMGPWYKYDVKIKRHLIIIMERSKTPMILRAGKIVDLTYSTFTSVLKTSYSLVTVLNNYD